ncbi:MAG TPA: PhoU domain-containing protein [Pseudonocardiaceae bacterium]|nr:PhoU domain-containing protein [Pseudonocardiaceae bacterium]
MAATFHAALGELITSLARMTRLAGQMMTNAAIALHQTDPTLAGVVIAKCDQMTATLADTEQGCIILFAQQTPVVEGLRAVVAAVHSVHHLKRMANLARHIAIIPQLKYPNPVISSPVRPVLARMSLLASQLAGDAATAIEYRDPSSGDRLAEADDEVDTLHRHLFDILFAEDWSHGIEPAVDAALIGRYYERFADHAVAIARQVRYLVIDRISEPDDLGLTFGSQSRTRFDDLARDSQQVAATSSSRTNHPITDQAEQTRHG